MRRDVTTNHGCLHGFFVWPVDRQIRFRQAAFSGVTFSVANTFGRLISRPLAVIVCILARSAVCFGDPRWIGSHVTRIGAGWMELWMVCAELP